MTTILANSQRRTLPRPQITTVTKTLVTIHRPAVAYDDCGYGAVSYVQLAGTSAYRVDGLRVRVYCPAMLEHRDPNDRQPWQTVTVPSTLDSHQAAVDWLVGTLTNDAAELGAVA